MATVNEKMTALADKIRVLSGTQDAMGLDAMTSNVDNANTAVASALSALVEKGVEVPDGTNVDGLAALIAAIESGGGLACAHGDITPASDIYGAYTVTHNIGVIPKLVLVYATSHDAASIQYSMSCMIAVEVEDFVEQFRFSYTGAALKKMSVMREAGTISADHSSGQPIFKGTENTVTINFSNATIKAGYTYRWVAVG